MALARTAFGGTDHALFKGAVTGLRPAREYEFVISTDAGFTKRGWFRTAPGRLTLPLSFVVGGDMDSGEAAQRTNQLAGSLDPTFALIGGDLAFDIAHELDADDAGDIVVTCLDIAHGGEHRH